MDAKRKNLLNSVGLLILRVGVGGYMLTHGIGKLRMLLAGEFENFDPIGIGGTASTVLVTFAEFLCAALVVVGLGTRLAAVPLVFAMGVAALVAHGSDPWTMETAAKRFFAGETKFPASKELPLLFLIPFLTLVFTGPGVLSVDSLIARRWRGRAEA